MVLAKEEFNMWGTLFATVLGAALNKYAQDQRGDSDSGNGGGDDRVSDVDITKGQPEYQYKPEAPMPVPAIRQPVGAGIDERLRALRMLEASRGINRMPQQPAMAPSGYGQFGGR